MTFPHSVAILNNRKDCQPSTLCEIVKGFKRGEEINVHRRLVCGFERTNVGVFSLPVASALCSETSSVVRKTPNTEEEALSENRAAANNLFLQQLFSQRII